MACVIRLRLLSGKLGTRFPFHRNTSACYQYTNVSEFCLSACHSKIPSAKPVTSSGKQSECDLDFFGVNSLKDKDQTPLKSVSDLEEKKVKPFINKIVQRGNALSEEVNVKKRSYGSIRYDNEIPKKEKLQKLTRKQKRLQTGLKAVEIETHKALLTLSKEQKLDSIDNDQLVEREENFNDLKQLTKTETSKNMTEINQDLSFVDKQYFANNYVSCKESFEHERKTSTRNESFKKMNELIKSENTENLFENEQDLSFVDRQFFLIDHEYKHTPQSDFQKITVNESENHTEVEKLSVSEDADTLKHEKELNFFDEQYFNNTRASKHIMSYENKSQKSIDKLTVNQPIFDIVKFEKSLYETKNSDEAYQSKTRLKKYKVPENTSNEDLSTGKNLTEENQSVYAASMKMRGKFEKKRGSNLTGTYDPKEYDSKGFRILSNQVPHFDNAPSIDVVKVLRRSIIYDENDIVAISKPYGLPSVNGPKVFHSVANLLDEIIPNTKLFRVHRLDKDTTGVMLLARTEEMAKHLSERFYNRTLVKKYVVITKNIPEMPCGEIDIPVIEGTVDGKARMCLRPHDCPTVRAVDKKRQPGKDAITKYRVLDQGQKCALVECWPLTGKKHQIRVHLAFGLNCPILGDHKYSHIDRLAPMKLHPEILKRLHIQESKVRYLAMHLHCRSIMIPEFLDGKNLFIRAPVPPHFIRNMKDLKLKFPKER